MRLGIQYRIALAGVFFIIASLFRFHFIPLESGGPFVTFYPAIILSFYFCGIYAGILIALLSGLAGAYFFLSPYNQFPTHFHISTTIFFFSITSGLIGFLISNMNKNIEQLESILNNEMIGSLMLEKRKILWSNKAMSKILGYSETELMGASTKMLFAEIATFDEIGRDAYPLIKGKPYRKQFEMRKADGSRIWVDVSGSTMLDRGGKSLWLVNDISELKRLEAKLENQVNYDYLTKLHARSWFIHQFEIEFNRSQRYGSALSFLMLDLDLFKHINDTYGHQTGDLVLKNFADLIKSELREFDICGRLGGEEFAILLPDTNESAAYQAAERLRSIVYESETTIEKGKVAIKFTVSIGIATLSADMKTTEDLVNKADKALYQAKNSGRNKVGTYTA